MSRLTALVPGAVCAAALGRAWPQDRDGQVRCIDEGSRALGLQACCAPWSPEAEDAALLAELGEDVPPLAELGESVLRSSELGEGVLRRSGLGEGVLRSSGPGAAARRPSELGNVATAPTEPGDGAVENGTFERLDAVASGLVRTPGAGPVLGLVSGPLGWGARQASEHGRGLPVDPVEAIDAASDLAADRIRALTGCGVQRIAVVELGAPGLFVDADLAAEFHEAIIRAADHLRVDLLLVAPAPVAGVASPAELGYERWAGPDRCSDGLAFLPSSAFSSTEAVARCVAGQRTRMASADTVLTAPLGADTDSGMMRHAAGLLAATGRGNSA